MTKFGVYHGKDKAFRKEYAGGGAVSSPYMAADFAPDSLAAKLGQTADEANDMHDKMDRYLKKKHVYQDAFDKAQAANDAATDAKYGSQ